MPSDIEIIKALVQMRMDAQVPIPQEWWDLLRENARNGICRREGHVKPLVTTLPWMKFTTEEALEINAHCGRCGSPLAQS